MQPTRLHIGRLLLRRRIRHLPLNMDIYLYISMYIQAEYRRFGVFNFLNFNYCTCYILFYCDVLFITAAGGRGIFVYFRQTACISFIITAFIVF